jgi:MFS family permease
MLFIVPLYLQQARHFSALSSGLTTFPEALGVLSATQVAGRLYPVIGPRRLAVGGLTWLCAVLIVGSSLFNGNTSLWLVRLFMFGMGVGIGFVLISQQAAAFATITADDMGRATAISATVRQAASAAGVALLATILTVSAGHNQLPRATNFRAVFLTAAVMMLVGAGIALRIRDAAAARTMRARPVLEAADNVPIPSAPLPVDQA